MQPDMEALKPAAAVVVVDAATAERWLGKNRTNRNIRPNLVAAYARDMAAGRWEMTGEAVKFAKDGTLLDGQHRLLAIVKSGTELPMLVVRGLGNEVQTVMDTGAKRTAADALHMGGLNRATYLAAGARLALALEAGFVQHIGNANVTHAEIREFVNDHPGLIDAAEMVAPLSRVIAAPKSVLTYVAWRLGTVDSAAAKEFLTSVATQEMLRRDDPQMVLAKRLNNIRESRIAEPAGSYIALFFRAWNHWRKGETVSHLKVPRPITIPNPR